MGKINSRQEGVKQVLASMQKSSELRIFTNQKTRTRKVLLKSIIILGVYILGMIQKLRNAVVAPTGMGKNYGRIMPLLRQGWLVRQKIMHYGFFGQCFSGCLCSQEETSQLQPILLFWKIP